MTNYKNKRMENAHYWAAQLLGWMKDGPNAGLRGTYYVDVVAGQPVLVMDGDAWNLSKISAIKTALRDYGFPQSLRVTDLTDDYGQYRLFIKDPTDKRFPTDWYPGGWRTFEPTGGDLGDPDAMFAADQLDTWETPPPEN